MVKSTPNGGRSNQELSAAMREQVDACLTRAQHNVFFGGIDAPKRDVIRERIANLILTCLSQMHRFSDEWQQHQERANIQGRTSSEALTPAMREQLEAFLNNLRADLLPTLNRDQEQWLRESVAHTVLSCIWIGRGEIGPQSVH